ncbi:hypothetical protein [Campylobacter hyointestinalis]|uniref:hypothetical protein n=1 Tax=Campylobacter hyointestinalis TaxID=198 RepID=UPI000CE38FBC|nr:hypothetical protein [Campylobacter hyointestinalis]PPB52960.1 hypothetical protein CDQ69_06025 [Campylobacter hyointestinalis subsp. hyointestinalis]PPB63132.1 hypothetical protein CDQ72_01680 [Campylobacter hyointestinalis subsp. hyointestinalis]PPB65402.1 hypothetical protein CDQ73_01430 [Campylobacter hyointestinalis subsp. hyointestinalis]PPB70065.1 hypothetical protein CDQ77_02525 [Campylobacter hyointestinalis subsp. hyointestinalis]
MEFKKTVIRTTFFALFCVAIVSCDSDSSQKQDTQNRTLNFFDLPKTEQDWYIKKDELDKYGEYFTVDSYAKNFNIDDNQSIEGSIDELKAQIRLLREKNRLLFEDNAQFMNKNWAIMTKLREQQNSFDNEKKLINAKNLEIMNDVEKQHYKNINDLTKKINEVQKENLLTIKAYEQKIVSLENQIDTYQKKLQQSALNFDDKIATSTKEERLKNSDLAQKNRYLLEQIESLKKSMAFSINDLTKQIEEKKIRENELEQSILQKEAKINDLLASHTNEILELQKKNSQDLKDLKNEIVTQKKEYFDELNLKSSEYLKLANEYENYKKDKQKEFAIFQQNLAKTYKDAEEKKANDIKNDFLRVIVEQNATISLLNARISSMEAKFRSDLEAKDKEYAKSLQALKDKALFIEQNENRLKAEFDQNVSSFKQALKQKDVKISELNAQIQDLIKSQTDGKMIKNYEILNEDITKLKLENENLKKFSEENLQKSKELVLQKDKDMKMELDKLKEHYESIIKDLKIGDFNMTSTSSLNGKKSIDEIKCELKDNAMTKECQSKFNDLLKKYGAEATYEIIALIPEFKHIDSSQTALLSSMELRSTTSIMSLASEPLKSKFGSKLKIVYAKEIKFEKSGYGFLIRVYK